MASYGLSLFGGVVIGLAATLLLLANGRVAGVSGMFGGAILPGHDARPLRLWFLGGLAAAGLIASVVVPSAFAGPMPRIGIAAIAGILVGYGTRLGNGCTSGHGVCGLARFSKRSLVATIVFMGTGMLTVLALRMVYR